MIRQTPGRLAASAGAAGRPPAGAGQGGDARRLALLDGRLRLRVRLRLLPLPLLPRRRRMPSMLGALVRAKGPFIHDVRKVCGPLYPIPLCLQTVLVYSRELRNLPYLIIFFGYPLHPRTSYLYLH